jgi:hypothetical protein
MDEDKDLIEFITDLDMVIAEHQDKYPPHSIAGILLSRVTLLMIHDPVVGKELLKFVWNKLDELEQSNPGQYL